MNFFRGLFFALVLCGSFYGLIFGCYHIGLTKGRKEQMAQDQKQLEQCQVVIARNLYAR